jgi:tetratricopeptide (TPR) repeat protein
MRHFILFTLSLMVTIFSFSQTTEKYESEYENYFRAEELFEKEQYAAARLEFRNFIETSTNKEDPFHVKARYYEAVSALEIKNTDAIPMLELFLKEYPESILRNTIYFKLGQYYFENEDYPSTIAWLTQLNPYDIEKENHDEYMFKLGYSYFKTDDFKEARNAFYEVKDSADQYFDPALYYYSYIYYSEAFNDPNKAGYEVAKDGFKKLENKDGFSKIVPYYIAQIYHLQEQYDSVIVYAPSILESAKVDRQNDLNHIIGHAYYKTKDFEKAVGYLEKYNSNANTTRDDDYELAFSYYKTGNYNDALKLFYNVAGTADSLGQVSYYQMGECYMKLDNLNSARSSFEKASEMTFDKVIQEDALYNFAVLSYKLDSNPYDEAVIALENFLTKFPNSSRKSDMNQYLVNVYTSTNNYSKAIASLEKIPNKDNILKMAYQLVAFNKGVELFQQADYKGANDAFQLSMQYPIDAVIFSKAKYWTAEGLFIQKENDKAIKIYKEFLTTTGATSSGLKSDAYYNLGYAYLIKDDISQSIESFRTFCQSNVNDKTKLVDGYMRAADGCYMLSQNENAIKFYKEALKLDKGFQDQALYYLAKTYGYSMEFDNKISSLLELINDYPNSKFYLQGVYELANCYKSAKEDYDNALKYFNIILTESGEKSDIVMESRIEIADIYFKKWQYSKAETEYKKILTEFGQDQSVCESVVVLLLEVYKAMKDPDKAAELASLYPCANISQTEQEDLFYSPAFASYEDSLYTAAIPQFEKYLQKYPKGIYSLDANYYLANCYYSSGDKSKGIQQYELAVELGNHDYTDYALGLLSQHYYTNTDYSNARKYYSKLSVSSSEPSVIFAAMLGTMRCDFNLKEWTNAVSSAQNVLSSTQLTNNLKIEAEYIKGISYFSLNKYAEAKTSLEWLTKNTTTAKAHEAKYTLSLILFNEDNYPSALTSIEELFKIEPKNNYWKAKGAILKSNILYLTEKPIEAKDLLEKVIKYYAVKDDGIVDEANDLLSEINSSMNKTKNVTEETETEIDINEGGN